MGNFATMKKYLFLFIALATTIPMMAQRIAQGPLHSADDPRSGWLLPGDTIYNEGRGTVYGGKPVQLTTETREQESLQPPLMPSTYGWGLHQGLNVSIDLSAFATFGKGVPHHGGFGQTLSAAYLSPLSRDGKWWVAGGGYLNNIMWGGDSYRDAGLYAMLGYKINDKWELYAYGQLSLANNYGSYRQRYYTYGYPNRYALCSPLYGWMGMGPMGAGMGAAGANVLGVGALYHVNRSLTIGLSVEGVWYNQPQHQYFDQYNYPVPLP